MKMLSTSTHNRSGEITGYNTYDITGLWDREPGRYLNDKSYPLLEPKYIFWKTWNQNIRNLPKEENDKCYVEQYYEQVLLKLDPEQVYNDLGIDEELDGSILLCDDEITRYIVGAWFKIFLGQNVPECTVIQNIGRLEFDQCTAIGIYAKTIESYLEETIRKDLDMKGFHSLRALYLFKKAERLEQKALALGERHEDYNFYMQYAYYRYYHANAVESGREKQIERKYCK